MKLGIYLNAQHPAADDPARRFAETLEQARLIRSLGFDSIWGGEHHVTPGFHYFPLLPMLQRLAAEAPGLEIGTNLVLLPLHNPVEIAEIGAFLDVITGGRFLLGVGLGYRPEEFAVFGVPMAERVSRLVEGVEIIRRLWTEDKVTHRGRHWAFENVTIRPRPLRAPRPPILVGSQVPAGIARAARIADGWLVVPLPRVDEFAAQARAFSAARAAVALAPSPHVCRLLEVVCAPDEETAIRRAAPYLLDKYAAYFSWGLEGLDLDPGAPPEEQLRRLAVNRFALGSPEQVVEALVAQHAAGATHLTMRVSWPGMPQADVLAGIELLGRRVLPEVRRRTTG
ncbi:MAG TPA: LLM class flavin-dependent oxidoreductase [Methylomirabilota bacterium]|jgi:alkanesulfonate monooxygenase SsuD/methylene tetrahydromethanopterin reductase-like flavin-dependent oxidoreductase (luciferase family)